MVEWTYFLTKVLASVASIFLLVQIIIISGSVLFWDSNELSVFVANSFYTSNDNEQNVSWQVLTSPPWNGIGRGSSPATNYQSVLSEHKYECMWMSQQGWTKCQGQAGSVATYKSCLDAQYGTEISACSAYTASTMWPTLDQYSNCINNRLGQNNSASTSSRWTLNALTTCLRTDLWPLYEIAQDVDSFIFLGAFSWPLFCLTSAFLMSIFAIYTFYPVDFEDSTFIEKGKPTSSFARLGLTWTILPVLLGIGWLFVILLIAFRANTVWPDTNSNYYPSTQQTNIITVTATVAVLSYFLLELSEFQDKRAIGKGPDKNNQKDEENDRQRLLPGQESNMGIPMPALMGPGRGGLSTKIFTAPKGGPGTGYYFPDPNEMRDVDSIKLVKEQYAPVLLNTWADAYLLHPVLFVGVVGATFQLFTADVYNIFWCLMFNRIAHTGIARAVYHCYLSPHTAGENLEAKDSFSATKTLAFSMHLAALCALFVVAYIIFNSSRMFVEFQILTSFFILSYIIPESLRVLGHLWLVFTDHQSARDRGIYVLLGLQFIWAWDLIITIIYLWLVFWGSSSNRGTKPFLLSNNQALMSMLAYASS